MRGGHTFFMDKEFPLSRRMRHFLSCYRWKVWIEFRLIFWTGIFLLHCASWFVEVWTMAPMYGYSGDSLEASCPEDSDVVAFPEVEVNKAPSPTPSSPNSNYSPQTIRSRRDRSSQQQSARQQRSATTSLLLTKKSESKKKGFHRTSASLPGEALAAVEPPHEHRFKTKMAYEDQQKWITVQQKTFTKWYHSFAKVRGAPLLMFIWCRLNTKIEPRELIVVDLVKDLSDGVSNIIGCEAEVSGLY